MENEILHKEGAVFNKLKTVDMSNNMKEKNGMTYAPWALAWTRLLEEYPESTHEVHTFGEDGLPYLNTPLGLLVKTSVTVEDITREMWLPVLDSTMNPLKDVPYTKKMRNGEKEIHAATAFDINKSILRCLTKNIALFGLGLHLWFGEDLPESSSNLIALRERCFDLAKATASKSEKAQEQVKKLCDQAIPGGAVKKIDNPEVLEKLISDLKNVRK